MHFQLFSLIMTSQKVTQNFQNLKNTFSECLARKLKRSIIFQQKHVMISFFFFGHHFQLLFFHSLYFLSFFYFKFPPIPTLGIRILNLVVGRTLKNLSLATWPIPVVSFIPLILSDSDSYGVGVVEKATGFDLYSATNSAILRCTPLYPTFKLFLVPFPT